MFEASSTFRDDIRLNDRHAQDAMKNAGEMKDEGMKLKDTATGK